MLFLGIIPDIYANRNIYLSLAGSGDPWSYFKVSSKLTLRALFDGYSLEEIQKIFQISKDELQEKIDLLVDAGLLKTCGGKFVPSFLIVNEEETERTFWYAKEIGKMLAKEFMKYWKEVNLDYQKLKISEKYSINKLSLVLIGSKILDIALLEVLAKDGSLLQPAPNRPSSKNPEARYYFYMVEGEVEYLGKYGENSMDLPKKNWTFVTFGLNIIDGKENPHRNEIENKCDLLRKQGEIKEPEDFAEKLNSPFLSREDSIEWLKTTKKIASKLLVGLKKKEKELIEFYENLKISNYSNNSFGEFMCWFIHIAYSWAIDYLVEKKMIKMPENKYQSIVIYSDRFQGLLTK